MTEHTGVSDAGQRVDYRVRDLARRNRRVSGQQTADILVRAVIGGTPVDNQIAVWTNGTTIEGTSDFTFDGADLLFYNAVNDGNPEIRLGATDAEEFHLQPIFDSGAQTLDYVLFTTDVASATVDKGLYRFNVDGVDILDIDDGGLVLTGSVVVSGTVDGRDVASDGSKLDLIEDQADVTDTANVTSAGALMDSEIDLDLKTFSLPASTTISVFGATVIDDADAAAVRTTIGAGTGSGDALVANPLSQFASTTSLQLLGVISNETGTDSLVFANTPTLVTPVIGAATGTSLAVDTFLSVGVASPSLPLEITVDDAAHTQLTSYGSNVQHIGRTAQGTEASPTATLINNILFALGGRGFANSVFTSTTGLISIEAEENFTASAEGTRITFDTTPLGSTTRSEAMRINPAGDVGIRTTSPDGTLHVHTATAGTVTANGGADEIVLESDGNTGLTILAPDASLAQIYFGTPSDNVGAYIRWQHDSNFMQLGPHKTGADLRLNSGLGVQAMRILSDGQVGIVSNLYHLGDTNNLIGFTTDAQSFETGGSVRMDISDSGVRLGAANARVTTVLDEDTLSSDSDTSLATQQSIKAYVDSQIRYITVPVFGPAEGNSTGDGKVFVHVPAAFNGMNLISVHAQLFTTGTTGTEDIQIRNVTKTQDMLSTIITIDTGELSSTTAATPAVIDATKDDVSTNDTLAVDIDAVHSGGVAGGLGITLGFQLP